LEEYAFRLGKTVAQVVGEWLEERFPEQPQKKARLVIKTGSPPQYKDKELRGGGYNEL
jgi:hypothetical protein